jgi:uncharacterized membrane protein YjfL (UPF0719 family)
LTAIRVQNRLQANYKKENGTMSILIDYLKLIGWGTVGIFMMALSLWILLGVFTWLTPVDEWDELKKGNLAIAIVMASVIIGFALVISSAIAPPPITP